MKVRFLPLIISVIVAILLVLLVEGFIHNVIVEPLLYVLWFLTLFLGSIPHAVFWGIFILCALIIARKSVVQEKAIRRQTTVPAARNQGSVAEWSALLQAAEARGFSKWRLAQALKKLSRDVMAAQRQFDLDDDNGPGQYPEQAWPPDVRAFFETPLPWSKGSSRSWRRFFIKQESSALDLDPERVIEVLEKNIYPLAGD